jgi:glycosyltransferase involved in cell wall biosynthesis
LKWSAYDVSEVFVLPSHQENFGIVVAEALASGLPVLITCKVNVWREIQSSSAGLIEADTQKGIDCLLAKWLAMSDDDQALMRERALMCFRRHFDIQRVTKQLLDALEEVVRTPKAPFSSARSWPW